MSTPRAETPKKNRTVLDQHGQSYELTGRIGEGGQGIVCTTNYPNVLVKVARATTEEKRANWTNKIRALMRQPLEDLPIAHPLALITQPQPGYVMELMDGLTPMTELMQVATDSLMSDDGLSGYVKTGGLLRRLKMLARLARVLAQLHGRGLAYGDLSPSNVFASQSLEYAEVWLIDADNISSQSRDGQQGVFTPDYGAPEILRGETGINTLTDSWSFAVLAYRILTLAHPLKGDVVLEGEPEREEAALRGDLPWVDHPVDRSNALAMSQLHIFQGISGTGKTSLAKAFAKAVGGHCTDIAVQAGWRDRDDLLGHYNAFEKRFYERDCLQGLYRAQTDAYKDRCNIILLDEMNLSRPEQYFAEFLSALEKNDPRDRLISLSESRLPNAPALLVEGRKIRVPHNVWFVGTANHDETTNEFADKTYDRAHVMTLPRHEAGFKVEPKPKASFSYGSLIERFDAAVTQYGDEVSELLAELTTGPLTSILQDRFDLGWGNRLERQAMRFVPVYIAAGGRKEDALDHLLASRLFRRGKVTGRYDATIDDLTAIENALTSVWKGWKSEPRRSMTLLAEDRRRKERAI